MQKIEGDPNAALCKSESDEVLLKVRQPNDTFKSICAEFCKGNSIRNG